MDKTYEERFQLFNSSQCPILQLTFMTKMYRRSLGSIWNLVEMGQEKFYNNNAI